MVQQKIKYTLTTIMLIFIFSESCSTNSRGLFEKRKHLKGWHFHKKESVLQKSSNNRGDILFKQKNDVLNLKSKRNYSAKISPLKIRKSRFLNTKAVAKELVGFRVLSNDKVNKLQKKVSKHKQIKIPSESEGEVSISESKDGIRTIDNSWQLNGVYFFLLTLFPLVLNNSKRKQVQTWAARNKTKSRALLVVAKVLLASTSIGLGFLLGVPFSLPLLLLSIVLIVVSIGLSEYWNTKGELNQKKNLGILGVVNTSTSFGFFSLGGMLANRVQFSGWSLNFGLLNFSNNNPENELVNHTVYIITGTILLTVILVTLLGLIGWISCNVYCNSSEVLGIIIFAIGYFVFIFLGVYLIQKLFERENDSGESRKLKIAALIATIITVLLTLYISLFGFP